MRILTGEFTGWALDRLFEALVSSRRPFVGIGRDAETAFIKGGAEWEDAGHSHGLPCGPEPALTQASVG